MLYKFIIFFLIISTIVCILEYKQIKIKESFVSDPFSPLDAKLHNTVFDNPKLYQYDIKSVIKQIMKDKCIKDLKILDAGCGVGRHYKELVNMCNGAHIIGVDYSSNMLSQARINNPNGDFIKGNLLKPDLFSENTFDYIFSMLDTIYHNQNLEEILQNYRKWLKPNGILIIHIFDTTKLDPGSQPHTQYYLDDHNRKHGLTYYNGFAHDAYWEHDDDCIAFIQSYITDNGLKTSKKWKLYFPQKSTMIKTIKHIGFKLIDVISLNSLEIEDIELFCFRKT